MRRIMRADSLIGDRLMQIPALRAMKRAYPEDALEVWVPRNDPNPQVTGSEVLLQGLPYLDALRVWYSDSDREHTPQPGDHLCDLDTLAAYHWGVKNGKTISQGIGHEFGVEVADDDLTYDYHFQPGELEEGRRLVEELGQGKPVVAVARHSASCSSNDPRIGWANKCLANHIQVEIAQWLISQGFVPVALGSGREEKDIRYRIWPGVKLYGKPIRSVAAFLAHCHAVHSVDTGIRHLAAAVGANLHCVSGTIPLAQIRCLPVKPGQRIHEYYRPLQDCPAPYLISQLEKVL